MNARVKRSRVDFRKDRKEGTEMHLLVVEGLRGDGALEDNWGDRLGEESVRELCVVCDDGDDLTSNERLAL